MDWHSSAGESALVSGVSVDSHVVNLLSIKYYLMHMLSRDIAIYVT